MTEFHVEVVRVGPVEKHPNADALSMTKIHGGYPVCFRTGDYREGDLAVYVPVDAVAPDLPEWEFLGPGLRNHRIRAKKLRGLFSMGLLSKAPEGANEGDDMAEALGFRRYEDVVGETSQNKGVSRSDGLEVPAPKLATMPGVYDIEGFRKYGRTTFAEDEQVIVTEKIHGCVPAGGLVSMADGSTKAMSKIEVGEEVLGVDEAGRVIATPVLRKFNNGPASSGWLKLSGQRRRAGRGATMFALRCTPEHLVWSRTQDRYVPASTLAPGDRVSLVRCDVGLSPVQEQVLLGKLLGDGSFHPTVASAHVAWSHALSDVGYAEWTQRALGSLDSGSMTPRVSGYGSEMVACRTINTAWVKQTFESMVASGKKEVPEWVVGRLGPLALAFWYMDDGSLSHDEGQEDRASIATCGFSADSHTTLIAALKRLGVDASHACHGGISRLSLNADNAERLFLLVAPYVPPCMQRKLPERYRGGPGWLPATDSEFRPLLVEQVVESVEVDTATVSHRYDMETATHNYFCNAVLVHNCNARFVHDGERLHVGSRTRWLSTDPETNTWAKVAQRYDLAEKLKAFPGLVFFGESYGNNSDMPYGVERFKTGDALAVFDIFDSNEGLWLDADIVAATCEAIGLPTVPVLAKGRFGDLAGSLPGLAEGPSTLAGHVREGWVIKPAVERWDPRLGRVILKMHGEGYLTRKSA